MNNLARCDWWFSSMQLPLPAGDRVFYWSIVTAELSEGRRSAVRIIKYSSVAMATYTSSGFFVCKIRFLSFMAL